MDRFSPEKLLGEIFWDESLSAANQSDSVQYSHSSIDRPFPPENQSTFVQYRDQPRISLGEESSLTGSSSQAMSKRMIGFLRKDLPEEKNLLKDERERCFRHMINEKDEEAEAERVLLGPAFYITSRNQNNNSVIQMAAKEIQRLQVCIEELQSKNSVLEANLEAVERNKIGENKVQYLRVSHPASGIESMVETLKYLKGLGVDTRSIKSNFSKEELSAVLEIEETKIADADQVERAIARTLDEDEWKLQSHFGEGSKRQRI